MTSAASRPSRRLLNELDLEDFGAFQKLCASPTDPALFPLASEIVQQVVIYDAARLLDRVRGAENERNEVLDELQQALLSGPGVFVMRKLVPREVIDRAEAVTEQVNPKSTETKGNNSRRTFAYSEKHAKHDPESYADYYGNDILAAVCEAWLGPGYQITATTNATFVGGNQQDIHRDYHVSHQSLARIRQFPIINQTASQFLTLQCAIAHTDMPLSTGPTRFMPYSQRFEKGYIAVRDPKYIDYVKPRMVQLELEKGDAVFFNPATFHQPGVNVTDQERVANLLQVSSAFGRSMESCDRTGMAKSVWPVMKRWHKELSAGSGTRQQSELDALIAATCSDYGYPKVFDLQVPGTPETQVDIVKKALREGSSDEKVLSALDEYQSWHQQ